MQALFFFPCWLLGCNNFGRFFPHVKQLSRMDFLMICHVYSVNEPLSAAFAYQSLIATKLGVQKITGITVFDIREKRTYDPLPDLEVSYLYSISAGQLDCSVICQYPKDLSVGLIWSGFFNYNKFVLVITIFS